MYQERNNPASNPELHPYFDAQDVATNPEKHCPKGSNTIYASSIEDCLQVFNITRHNLTPPKIAYVQIAGCWGTVGGIYKCSHIHS